MKFLLLAALLLIPQLAVAKVYMCKDPVTGKTSFTDKACEKTASREQVRVNVANPGSHQRKVKKNPKQAWQSQRDTSRSGLDHNQERRDARYGTNAAIASSGS